ncbi:MAG: hypothetical protein M3O71_17500 [Bacteroidota bacterium]|nr:hypothetical protein [Bacteroidota bacterium]
MNTENDKRLDDLFKKKLEDPVDEIRYEEGDWDALEQMLDKPKRKGIIFLWPFISSVAAIALLFFGWWMFKNQAGTKPDKDQTQVAARHNKVDTIVEHNQVAAHNTKKDTIVEHTALQLQAVVKNKPIDTIVEHKALKQTGTPVQKVVRSFNDDKSLFAASAQKQRKDTIIEKNAIRNNRMADELVAMNAVPAVSKGVAGDKAVKSIELPRPVVRPGASQMAGLNGKKGRTSLAYRPQYTLSVIAAPDFNGVGSFQQSKVGTNIGMTFAVGLSKKFTITTGALYSVKPYLTNFNNYNTGSTYKWAVNPINVTADCRMLDIPLNVGYQVYHRSQNKISVGTGLSSYLMLHESYKFQYEYGGPQGPTNYTVAKPGKYFFGIVNLNATYERQVTSKVGVSIQPYLKLPLSNVGYSQVKLQTTGVAVGLSWNLNSLTKP